MRLNCTVQNYQILHTSILIRFPLIFHSPYIQNKPVIFSHKAGALHVVTLKDATAQVVVKMWNTNDVSRERHHQIAYVYNVWAKRPEALSGPCKIALSSTPETIIKFPPTERMGPRGKELEMMIADLVDSEVPDISVVDGAGKDTTDYTTCGACVTNAAHLACSALTMDAMEEKVFQLHGQTVTIQAVAQCVHYNLRGGGPIQISYRHILSG